ADSGRIEWLVDDAEIARRRGNWRPRRAERLAGVLEKYAKLVGPANLGAVTHSGRLEWPYE
ncbi:MAG: dihydroxy-acid dehydratase, partial [Candidatus Binatia bacterium]